MASPITRTLYRSTRCRLYSSQAAALKADQLQSGGTKVSTVNGIKVATLENNSPLSRVLVVVQAGSRYEDPSNLGITHLIRHASELTNDQKSSFRLSKDLQFHAGCVEMNTTRDFAFYGVSCVRENIEANAPNLVGMVTRSIIKKFDWEAFGGFKSRLEFDLAALDLQPNAKVFELLHAAAFRGGLGNSLYSPSTFVGKHTPDQILSFMSNNYTSDRVAVVGSGVNHDFLASLARQITFKQKAGSPSSSPVIYTGGELRENRPDLEYSYAAVATQGPSASSKDQVAAGVLQQIMGSGTYIKFSTGTATSKLAQAISKQTDLFSVKSFNANYSDTGLFGFVVAAQSQDLGKVLKSAFSEFAAATKGGITDADVQRGKAQLKTYVLMNSESSDSQVKALGESMFGAGVYNSASDVIKAIDSVTAADVNSVAKRLVNGKPSMASVGDLSSTPYLEDLMKV